MRPEPPPATPTCPAGWPGPAQKPARAARDVARLPRVWGQAPQRGPQGRPGVRPALPWPDPGDRKQGPGRRPHTRPCCSQSHPSAPRRTDRQAERAHGSAGLSISLRGREMLTRNPWVDPKGRAPTACQGNHPDTEGQDRVTPLLPAPGGVRFTETGSRRVGARGAGRRSVLGAESQSGTLRRFWRPWWGQLHNCVNTPALHCTLKHGSDGNFHFMCILPQLKGKKKAYF